MSVYGMYGGLPGWVIDKVFTSQDEMINDNTVLSGRFVILKTMSEEQTPTEVVSLYQRTPGVGSPVGWTEIFKDIDTIQLDSDVDIQFPDDKNINQAYIDTNHKLHLILGKLGNLENTVRIEATPLDYYEDDNQHKKLANRGTENGNTVYNKAGVELLQSGAINISGTTAEQGCSMSIGTYWKLL